MILYPALIATKVSLILREGRVAGWPSSGEKPNSDPEQSLLQYVWQMVDY